MWSQPKKSASQVNTNQLTTFHTVPHNRRNLDCAHSVLGPAGFVKSLPNNCLANPRLVLREKDLLNLKDAAGLAMQKFGR